MDFPHTVPTGYFRQGDDVLLGVRNNTLKIRNIRYNPRVSLMIESGSTRQDIKGVMIQGNAAVIDDPDEFLHYAREAAKLRGVAEADLPTEPRPGAAYIKVTPHKIRSWDYSGRTLGNQRLTCHDYCNCNRSRRFDSLLPGRQRHNGPAQSQFPLAEFGKSLDDADLDEWFEAFAERNSDMAEYEISNTGHSADSGTYRLPRLNV